MSVKAKIFAFSAAGLLAVAGGVYAFIPDNRDSTGSQKPAGSVQSVPAAGMGNPPLAPSQPVSNEGTGQSQNPAVASQPALKGQPEVKSPKKLTKQQLTPPPATENEKLERAAEQESNF